MCVCARARPPANPPPEALPLLGPDVWASDPPQQSSRCCSLLTGAHREWQGGVGWGFRLTVQGHDCVLFLFCDGDRVS